MAELIFRAPRASGDIDLSKRAGPMVDPKQVEEWNKTLDKRLRAAERMYAHLLRAGELPVQVREGAPGGKPGKRFTIKMRTGMGAKGFGVIEPGRKRPSEGYKMLGKSRMLDWLSNLEPQRGVRVMAEEKSAWHYSPSQGPRIKPGDRIEILEGSQPGKKGKVVRLAPADPHGTPYVVVDIGRPMSEKAVKWRKIGDDMDELRKKQARNPALEREVEKAMARVGIRDAKVIAHSGEIEVRVLSDRESKLVQKALSELGVPSKVTRSPPQAKKVWSKPWSHIVHGDIRGPRKASDMDELRKQVIKIAYENPGEVRDALLPLLREAEAEGGEALSAQGEGDEPMPKAGAHEKEAAEEISLSDLPRKHLTFAKQFGGPTEAWEGIHGIIVKVKIAQSGMSPRWSKDKLKKMVSNPSFRWVEGHQGGATFGLTHS